MVLSGQSTIDMAYNKLLKIMNGYKLKFIEETEDFDIIVSEYDSNGDIQEFYDIILEANEKYVVLVDLREGYEEKCGIDAFSETHRFYSEIYKKQKLKKKL